jgi:hypothetical protein
LAILEDSEDSLFELSQKLEAMDRDLERIEMELMNFESLEISNRDISEAFESVSSLWGELFPAERYRLAHLLIEKIIVLKDKLKMEIKSHGMSSLVKELLADESVDIHVQDPSLRIIQIDIPVRLKRKSGSMVIIAPNSENEEDSVSAVQDSLVKNLVKAHAWTEMLETGKVSTVTRLAEKLNLDKSYVWRILRLVNLAPDIQEAILNGSEPDGLSMNKLRGPIPVDWNEQRELFGFNKKEATHA